jgi:hypothetical protein
VDLDEIVMEERVAMFQTVKQFHNESDQRLRKERNDMDNILHSERVNMDFMNMQAHSDIDHKVQ